MGDDVIFYFLWDHQNVIFDLQNILSLNDQVGGAIYRHLLLGSGHTYYITRGVRSKV